jgi:tetratricopeptide (TPR) repeat protein
MKKKVFLGLVFVSGLLSTTVFAQSIDNAKKMFYYERYKSAKADLEKLVAADAKNVEASYWLVQTLLAEGKKADAKKVAAAAVAANSANPLALVAVGHVELADNNKTDAKSRFETAISLADKKSLVNVLSAIGRANGSVGLRQSEPDYGIEKLKLALQKEPNNAEVYMLLGDNYRRKLDGGNAVDNYESALQKDAKLAKAAHRIGQIYKTQDNCAPMKAAFTNATNIDPNFMPAWRELYDSYANNESQCFNLADAKTYFDRYYASTDQGIETDMLKMSFAYFSKDFTGALTEANAITTKYGEDANVDMYTWKAYIQNQMGDSISAKNNLTTYFAKQTDASLINPALYQTAGAIFAKVAGEEKNAELYYNKFIDATESVAKKSSVINRVATMYYTKNDFVNAAKWYKRLIETKQNPSAVDYFYAGYSAYNSQDFNGSATIFNTYATKYPTDWRGNYWAGRSYAVLDSTMAQGLAIPSYEKFFPIAQADSVASKNSAIDALKYVFIYYMGVKKDKATAKSYLDKLKVVDPTNAQIPEFESYLSGTKQATTPTKGTTVPKTGTNTGTKPTSGGTSTTTKPVTTTTVTKTPPKTATKTPVKAPVKAPAKPPVKKN